jgi:type IV secretion system protein VirB7
MKRAIALVGLAMMVTGCTTAGPYVTNISSDGNNGLNIEKCAVKLNALMGVVSTAECTSQRIRLRN